MGKRAESAKRTRAALEKATGELVAEKGVENVNIMDITTRAGVSVGSFYTYFQNKEAILQDIAYQEFKKILESIEQCDELRPALRGYLLGSVDFISLCGVKLCSRWLVSIVDDKAEQVGMPGPEKLSMDIGFVSRIFEKHGVDVDPSVPELIVSTYYGIVLAWSIRGGTTDMAKTMQDFCDGPLDALLRSYGQRHRIDHDGRKGPGGPPGRSHILDSMPFLTASRTSAEE